MGPGRLDLAGCQPEKACKVDPRDVTDHGDGIYTVAIQAAPGTPGVRLAAAGTSFDVHGADQSDATLTVIPLKIREQLVEGAARHTGAAAPRAWRWGEELIAGLCLPAASEAPPGGAAAERICENEASAGTISN